MRHPEIVVGVDGSGASRAALLWAAGQATRRDRHLAVLHAYDWRRPGSRMALGGEYAAAARERAQSVMDSALAGVREAEPGLAVRGVVVLGHPGPVLVAASKQADLVVVGSRGRGGFASMVLGSVSHQVAMHSAAPVVVVRGRPDATRGPVVVGVDGSPAANAALGLALEEAEARDCGLVALRVFLPAALPWSDAMPPIMENSEERRVIEHNALLEDVALWRDKFPQVPLECVVVEGHPAEVLAGISSTAQLVVVGTRGHGGFTGLLLGSTGLQLLHHADSPVLIAHTPAAQASETQEMPATLATGETH